MPKQKGVLTRKQTRFVDEYLVDLNATQAAIRAGYSARNADKIGPRLVGKSRVAAAIKVGQEKFQRKLEITQERVLQEMARVAFFDVRKLFNENGSLKKPHELDSDTAAAIASLDLDGQRIKSFGKPEALRDLAKHLGLFEKDNMQKPISDWAEILKLIDGKYRGLPAKEPGVGDKENR